MSSDPSSSYTITNGHTSLTNEHPLNGGSSRPVGSNTPEPATIRVDPQYASPPSRLEDELVNYLYQTGFRSGNYSDILLQVNQQIYRLHAIILSRSPYLAHLMSTRQSNAPIYIQFDSTSGLTDEGFAIALGYLYSPASLGSVRSENARGVLTAGCFLGNMEPLCHYAYEVCKQSISIETLDDWLHFVDVCGELGSSDPQFLEYARRLREDVFSFLVISLPGILDVTTSGDTTPSSPRSPQGEVPSPSHGRQHLLQIFSRVPFDMFKAAIESPEFRIGSDQARFKFAKEAIQLRKHTIARGTGAEEAVVLAFGGGGDGTSAVHVTRKKRKRELYKIGSA